MEQEEAGGLMDPLVYSMAQTTLYPEQIPSTVLHVYNLPYRIRWQDLKDLFRQEGTPIRAEVYLDIEGRSRGMGTVAMSSIDEAERCVRVFDGYEWFGRGLRVTMQFGTFASDNKHQPPSNVPDPILPMYTLAGTGTTNATSSSTSSSSTIDPTYTVLCISTTSSTATCTCRHVFRYVSA